MVSGLEPERLGLVASLARPEGNVTGVAWFFLLPKRIELLKEIEPNLRRVAYAVWGRESHGYSSKDSQDPAGVPDDRGKQAWIYVAGFSTSRRERLRRNFCPPRAEHFDTAYISGTPVNLQNQTRICQLALRHRIPTVSEAAGWARRGLLLTYGQDPSWSYARAMDYVDKILRGAKPSDLPVEQATKFRAPDMG
jgi:putative ABC transport system substrate-binding protein